MTTPKHFWEAVGAIAGVLGVIVAIYFGITSMPGDGEPPGSEASSPPSITSPTTQPPTTTSSTEPPPRPTTVSGIPLSPDMVRGWCRELSHSDECDIGRFEQLVEDNGFVNPYGVKYKTGAAASFDVP